MQHQLPSSFNQMHAQNSSMQTSRRCCFAQRHSGPKGEHDRAALRPSRSLSQSSPAMCRPLHQLLCRCSHHIKITLWFNRPGGKAEWRYCTEASRQPGEHQGVCAQQDTASPQLTGLDLQENGKAVSGPDLTVKLNGLTMPNPFVIGSGETEST